MGGPSPVSQGEAQGSALPLDCGWLSLPLLPVWMWVFFSFVQRIEVAHLVWGLLSEDIVLHAAVESVCAL